MRAGVSFSDRTAADRLARRAGDTSTWMSSGVDPTAVPSRSELVRPNRTLVEIAGARDAADFGGDASWGDILATINMVAEQRRRALSARSAFPEVSSDAFAREHGRWLLYDPSLTDFSGLSPSSSGGFFDNADAPGWECWVDAVHVPASAPQFASVLIAWVPARWMDMCLAGISVMPCVPTCWADEPAARNTPAGCLLREACLLA